jgi:predicted AlkP superfamily pyrophosphatase or phosphodiesterase
MLSVVPLSFLVTVAASKTIIVSIDGFGWNRYGQVPTPNLDSIRDRGVQARNMKNAFPTLTFPNHYTLATGMWVDGHGVVDNRMYDPEFDDMFDFRSLNSELRWWNGAEPIWITAEKNGIKTVSVNWPGDCVGWNGVTPSLFNRYSFSMPYKERIDRAVDAMFNSEMNADLGLIYFEQPDDASHKYGATSQEYFDAIQMVDSHIGYLLSRIDLDQVNLIIVSDHGTADVSKDKIIVVADHTSVPHFVSSWGPVAHVWPKHVSQTDDLYAELSASIPPEQGVCVRKTDLPPEYHFSNHRRIAPIVCIGSVGWVVLPDEAKKSAFAYKGHHGYSSEEEDSPLRPIFLAAGRDILNIPEQIPPFDMVHIYPLIAELIGIPRSALPIIDGNLDSISHIIRSKHD